MTTAIMMAGSTRPAVGRKRQPQSKSIARTYAGRFGARLASLCDGAGVSADELGERIGKSGDMVRRYFGGRSVPPLTDLPSIAKVLQVSVSDLMPD